MPEMNIRPDVGMPVCECTDLTAVALTLNALLFIPILRDVPQSRPATHSFARSPFWYEVSCHLPFFSWWWGYSSGREDASQCVFLHLACVTHRRLSDFLVEVCHEGILIRHAVVFQNAWPSKSTAIDRDAYRSFRKSSVGRLLAIPSRSSSGSCLKQSVMFWHK